MIPVDIFFQVYFENPSSFEQVCDRVLQRVAGKASFSLYRTMCRLICHEDGEVFNSLKYMGVSYKSKVRVNHKASLQRAKLLAKDSLRYDFVPIVLLLKEDFRQYLCRECPQF